MSTEKFIVSGPTPLVGTIRVAGAKNVALKALVATLLTDEEMILRNVPHIRDVHLMLEVLQSLGKSYDVNGDEVKIWKSAEHGTVVPLEIGARLRASSMVLGPLLARYGNAKIPNPGGCRIGARPIDRHIEGLIAMGAAITYHSEDGFFWANTDELHGADIRFEKNTHTGTETLMLAAALSKGETMLRNAAEEVEIDDLIALLRAMGASIQRENKREIKITGVEKMHGTTYTIMPDRNEEVTFAVAAVCSKGTIVVEQSQRENLSSFLSVFEEAGGGFENVSDSVTRYFYKGPLKPIDIVTRPHPGFMTDWQAPWALLMTQAEGTSSIHETVFENRFTYVEELQKMGAVISFVDPHVSDPKTLYNFNWVEGMDPASQKITIKGPAALHNAVLSMNDLRAGATLLLAAIIATGESVIFGIEQIDRGYEHIEKRLQKLGAIIRREIEDD